MILFNAFSLNNRLKGGDLLVTAIKRLAAKLESRSHGGAGAAPSAAAGLSEVRLLAVGAGTLDPDIGIPSHLLGHVDSDVELATAYRAADVFATASLQDNCPNTVLEAFATGVPVVGFATSGIADLVIPGQTGLLARPFDASDLAEKISMLVDDEPMRRKMSEICRRRSLSEYSRTVEAERYLALYEQVLSEQV